MADARTEKQKVKEITDRLEEGLKELFEGEKYKSYLNTMSKFHNYSANNIQLIEMQCPDATYVAGYKAWQRNFERHVNKGERGIRILSPAPYKIKEEQEKIDPVTNEPVLDRDGMPVMEEVEIKIPAFRVVTVFDYSQTDGKELPGLGVNELHGNVERYQDFMEALERVSPVPIRYEEMEGDRKGYFIDLSRPIAIKEGMSEAQTAKTGVHEVAHAKLHAREAEQDTEKAVYKDRETKEVEAESIAYTVCQHFGIDTSDYSFGYIAGWSSGKEMPELKSSLDTIRRTSSELIKGIEAQLLEIEKERVAEQSQEDIILLVSNTDRSEYDLLNVKGVERTEIFNLLSAMKDDDRQNVEAYLERAGAWVTLLANERSEEVEEYHLDYAYDTDTHEITDYKALQEEREKANVPIEYGDVIVRISMPDSGEYETIKIADMQSEVANVLYAIPFLEENEWNGNVLDYLQERGFEFVPIMRSNGLNDGYPQFYDFDVDMSEWEVHTVSELPATVQAEQLINRMEFHRSVYDSDERNLIMNHAYKLDDMYKTTSLAHSIAEQKDDSALLWETIRVAQEEIDALPDGMVGLSEMHEYGYSWDEMLPLTKDMASELFGEDVSVYQLHADGSETLVEDRAALQEHDGLFGVEKGDWNAYKEYQSMKQELEDSEPNREAQLLYGNEGRFGIYQLKDSAETRDIRFMDMDYLEKEGIPVSRENYTLVYTGELTEGMSLEDIYTKFNIDHPADFTGHSLSVSDVVVLHQDGENTSHYVDSVGYREIPEFTKELSVSAEISTEKDTVREETAEIPAEAAEEHTAAENTMAEPDNDKVSYYVIEDLSTWAENSPEKSRLERFESLPEAMAKFTEYRGRETEDKPDMARATFGFHVNGSEFDLIHVRNHENCLSLDFTHSKAAVESSRFMEDLQALNHEVGFDKVRVHREMSPEEIKDFVKQRFEYQLKSSGLDDISLYMDRFDALYGQGKMEHLMPTANQKHIVEDVPFTEWGNPYIDANAKEADRAETELAFRLADRYISIQEATEGYDYTIYDMDYRELDGGVYDNPDITIRQALDEIVTDLKEPAHRSSLEGSIRTGDELIPIDYDGLIEKAEQAEKEHLEERIRTEVPEAAESKVIADFKARTEELFNPVNGQTQEDIEMSVYAYLQSKIDEYGMDIELVDMAVTGSRCRGLEEPVSDLDVAVEYRGGENEDTLFNAFNEDGFTIGGVKVDINPITEGKTGTLGEYLPGVEAYHAEKRAALQEKAAEQAQEEKQTVVTLTVAECGEFHNFGEYHEGIADVPEAIAIFNQIPPERMNGIPSIGINIHTEGTESYEDTQMDIVSGRVADLEIL
ncbi:nucleotidyltransferase, partial [bacterium D16-51]